MNRKVHGIALEEGAQFFHVETLLQSAKVVVLLENRYKFQSSSSAVKISQTVRDELSKVC